MQYRLAFRLLRACIGTHLKRKSKVGFKGKTLSYEPVRLAPRKTQTRLNGTNYLVGYWLRKPRDVHSENQTGNVNKFRLEFFCFLFYLLDYTLPVMSFLVLSYRGPVFRVNVSPFPRTNDSAVLESTIQPHNPVSKLQDPGTGGIVGAGVGVVASSLQHMIPPALSDEMNEQPSKPSEEAE